MVGRRRAASCAAKPVNLHAAGDTFAAAPALDAHGAAIRAEFAPQPEIAMR
jgi:hypothetical protein